MALRCLLLVAFCCDWRLEVTPARDGCRESRLPVVWIFVDCTEASCVDRCLLPPPPNCDLPLDLRPALLYILPPLSASSLLRCASLLMSRTLAFLLSSVLLTGWVLLRWDFPFPPLLRTRIPFAAKVLTCLLSPVFLLDGRVCLSLVLATLARCDPSR